MKSIKFIRLIDGETIILTSQNKTDIQENEIVYINGYRYKANKNF
jgi:hypothetical protein